MEKIEHSNENIKTQQDIYIIKVQLNDGTVIYPAYISWNDIDLKQKLKSAINLFSSRYRNEWIVETIIDENILNTQEIKSFDTVINELFENENNDKVWKLLKELDELWIWAWFIDIMRKDLQVDDNKKLLETYLELSEFTQEEKERILLAMKIAIEAHKWDVQKRPQDDEWLDNIPYSNHPIQVAIIALRDLKMSAEEIEACLLHDVVEDTEIELNWATLKIWELEWSFSENTINMILDCTRKEWESREEFMEKMKLLIWKSKVIKCLDRLHNMVRAFSIKDSRYISRYLNETKEVYLPAFENMEELEPVKNFFFDVLEELELYYEKII